MIKIAITDDHTIFRKSLSLLINTFGIARVVLEASSGADLLHQLQKQPADIVLLDLQMPGMDGFETCAILHKQFPDVKILILSHLDSPNTIFKVMELGVDGYLTKGVDPMELKQALLNLQGKGFYFENSLRNVISAFLNSDTPVTNPNLRVHLTEREREIIRLAAQEYSGKEIGDLLNISTRTVEVHKKNLMEKTTSKNFIGVILYAITHAYLTLEDIKQDKI